MDLILTHMNLLHVSVPYLLTLQYFFFNIFPKMIPSLQVEGKYPVSIYYFSLACYRAGQYHAYNTLI